MTKEFCVFSVSRAGVRLCRRGAVSAAGVVVDFRFILPAVIVRQEDGLPRSFAPRNDKLFCRL